jgi:hypothetical protein
MTSLCHCARARTHATPESEDAEPAVLTNHYRDDVLYCLKLCAVKRQVSILVLERTSQLFAKKKAEANRSGPFPEDLLFTAMVQSLCSCCH